MNISHFNTSSATDLYGMFNKCTITNLNVSGFTNEKVKNMEGMFRGSKIQNLNLTNFSTANLLYNWHIFNNTTIEAFDFSATLKEVYDLGKFRVLIGVIESGTTIYVKDEECKILGESINPNLTYVAGNL